MCSIRSPLAVQVDPASALSLARERYPTLCSSGILGRKSTGTPVNTDEVAVALAFLAKCKRTKRAAVHSFDLRRAIGVSLGAVIVAATALDFEVRSWLGITIYAPHALIAVSKHDVRKAERAREKKLQ
jgi:hypothetical protein